MGKGLYTYEYPRPMVTVDAVVFTVRDGRLEVLSIKRGHEPFQGMWALPGGFVEMAEELDAAVARELHEETGVSGIPLEQFHTFGGVHRDPRGRVITVAYLGLADWRTCRPRGGDDATDADWLPVAGLPRIACDHNEAVACAVKRLRMLIRSSEDLMALLPATLSLEELRRALDGLPEARAHEGSC